MTAEADGIIELWPTVVLNRTLPGHEDANSELWRLIQDRERERPDMTTDYLQDNFLTVEHPATSWLRECINITVQDYFAHLGMNYSIHWTLQGWASVNRFGDYHDYHNHPHAYLSGTYYVQVPTDIEPSLETRGDVRSGRITLYDPRSTVNMTAIKGDPYIEPEHTIDPKPGTLLMWPAFINHFVHPNLCKTPRVSVSFNVVLKWSDDYLPQQV